MRYLRKAMFLLSLPLIAAMSNESLFIHPFIHSAQYCENCHTNDNKNIKDPSAACSTYCLTCHKVGDNHHPVNIKINEKLPDSFLLTGKKRITCITCHSLKQKRYDTSPWKSESLYENLFKGSSKYKTYFLSKKNNKGQLCKTCH